MNNFILKPCIPYLGLIDGDIFAPKKLIRINGEFPQATHRFDITLQCGPSNDPSKNNIALQISVRPLYGCIYLNSFCDEMWKEEKFKSPASIKRSKNFEIIVLCTSQQYAVFINGQHYFDYPQRIYYDKISHLSIDGDVSITQISYELASGSITDFEKISNVENGVLKTTSKLSSPAGNENKRIYPTLPLHGLGQSSCEKSSAPIQLTSAILQRNPVTNDVMKTDSYSVQNGIHFLNSNFAGFLPIIVFIIIISLFILWNGRSIYISSCFSNNSSSANQ